MHATDPLIAISVTCGSGGTLFHLSLRRIPTPLTRRPSWCFILCTIMFVSTPTIYKHKLLYILPNHASTTNFYTFCQTMLLPQTFIHFAKPCFYTCVKKGKISFVLEQNESHSKNGAFQSKLLFHSLRGDSFAFYSQHVKMVLLVRSMFLSQPFLSIQTSIYPYGFSP